MDLQYERKRQEQIIIIATMAIAGIMLGVMVIFAKMDLVVIHQDTMAKYLSCQGQVERLEGELYGEIREELDCIEKGEC